MKRAISVAIFLLFICSLLLAGCSASTETSATTSQNTTAPQNTTQGTGSPSGAKQTVKLAFTVPMEDPGGVGGAKFKEVLESESGGIITVNVFPAGQQGSMKDHWEGCQIGQLNVVYAPSSALETFLPEVSVLDLPFLFPSGYDTAWKVIDGDVGKELNKLMNEKGFELLGVSAYGYNQIHNSKREIQSVNDLAGLKIRIIPSPLKIYQYEQWGTNPTPIEFAELYSSLQQKVVDGGENALSVMQTQKLYEVQKYLTMSDHNLFTGLLAANKKWYDSLSNEEKVWLQDAAKANIDAQRKALVDNDAKILQFIKENGVTVTDLANEARQEWAEKSMSTHEEYASQSGTAKSLLDLVYSELEKNGVEVPK